MPEADVLYLGLDGKIHADEVKHTAAALVNKVRESAKKRRNYLGEMTRWAKEGRGQHVATIVIVQETRWTDLFSIVKVDNGNAEALLKILVDKGPELSVGGRRLDRSRMHALLSSLEARTRREGVGEEGGLTWPAFFEKHMRTIEDAARYAGVEL